MGKDTDVAADLGIAVMERRGAFVARDRFTADGMCRMERALAVIGTRSAMVLFREVSYGATRFEDLVNRSGLSQAVAAGRLKDLVAHGVLARRPYREPGARTRQEYVLTQLGAQLFPVLVSLMEWGELLDEDHDTGVELVHTGCGSLVRTRVECANGHAVDLGDAGVRLKEEPRAETHKP